MAAASHGDGDAVQPSWSPHGHRIAYWGMAGESAQRDLWTIDPDAVDPTKTVVRVNDDAAVDWNPVWSPDGKHLYFGGDADGTLNLWRVPIDERSGDIRQSQDVGEAMLSLRSFMFERVYLGPAAAAPRARSCCPVWRSRWN